MNTKLFNEQATYSISWDKMESRINMVPSLFHLVKIHIVSMHQCLPYTHYGVNAIVQKASE